MKDILKTLNKQNKMDTLIENCTFMHSILPITLQHATALATLTLRRMITLYYMTATIYQLMETVQQASHLVISTVLDKRTNTNIWQNVNSYSPNCLYWQKWRNRKRWKPSVETGGWLATFHNAFSKAIGEIIYSITWRTIQNIGILKWCLDYVL